MLEIDGKILSLDIITDDFCCDIDKCKGACCVEGDSGAPLEEEEALELDTIIEKILPYLRPQGVETIRKDGVHMVDSEGDVVTTLVDGKECAFTVFENGVSQCGIEKAFEAGEINIRKPISCYLYPIRRKKYREFDGLSYDRWDICHAAVKMGKKRDIAVYEFLEKPLTFLYGKEWYGKLVIAAKEFKKNDFS
jgi:hypothetical protein